MSRQNLWTSIDNYKRQVFLKNEVKKTILRSVVLNKNTTYTRRYLAKYYMTNLPRFSNKTITNTRCVYSGRSWGTNRTTLMSRFVHRSKIYNADIPGYSRASW